MSLGNNLSRCVYVSSVLSVCSILCDASSLGRGGYVLFYVSCFVFRQGGLCVLFYSQDASSCVRLCELGFYSQDVYSLGRGVLCAYVSFVGVCLFYSMWCFVFRQGVRLCLCVCSILCAVCTCVLYMCLCVCWNLCVICVLLQLYVHHSRASLW